MSESLQDYLKTGQYRLNEYIMELLEKDKMLPDTLAESVMYSMRAGGKRLRPILMLAAFESFGGQGEKVLPVAAALEMVHTYSLIHDDLPAMDDDDYRRGQLTNHKKFGEATAILAGDALLTRSFSVIGQASEIRPDEKVYLMSYLSEAAGATGMIAGQALDMEAEDKESTLYELEQIHNLKTGKLLTYAIVAGAFLAGVKPETLELMKRFGTYIGLIFQIQDDILDVTGDESVLGKPVGSDEVNNKSTYPKLLGLNGAKAQMEKYVDLAHQCLEQADIKSSRLHELTVYLSTRTS
ncbi:geranylgeranyl diphosphate synthase, type II [Terribacillus halophilus]|uniref:Farnesyl diphosphate synthase n=1 Tax=Terribacillus halophilus TaxID=361279 RepID=A0A1G6VMH8_9BACI|nr:farnesyl diphosphate synthase [Terribacillus halophilus]SDD54840.1 geranylgeranyl diphosphate synthase, type II [Terribacillus halophilus]